MSITFLLLFPTKKKKEKKKRKKEKKKTDLEGICVKLFLLRLTELTDAAMAFSHMSAGTSSHF
jgi:hypothetical protein